MCSLPSLPQVISQITWIAKPGQPLLGQWSNLLLLPPAPHYTFSLKTWNCAEVSGRGG